MEVCKADDIASGGFGSSSLSGTIYFGRAAFVTGRRSPSSTSHDAILSVKLDQPHGSMEKGKKAL
jgi:hypothetical protein